MLYTNYSASDLDLGNVASVGISLGNTVNLHGLLNTVAIQGPVLPGSFVHLERVGKMPEPASQVAATLLKSDKVDEVGAGMLLISIQRVVDSTSLQSEKNVDTLRFQERAFLLGKPDLLTVNESTYDINDGNPRKKQDGTGFIQENAITRAEKPVKIK